MLVHSRKTFQHTSCHGKIESRAISFFRARIEPTRARRVFNLFLRTHFLSSSPHFGRFARKRKPLPTPNGIRTEYLDFLESKIWTWQCHNARKESFSKKEFLPDCHSPEQFRYVAVEVSWQRYRQRHHSDTPPLCLSEDCTVLILESIADPLAQTKHREGTKLDGEARIERTHQTEIFSAKYLFTTS